MINLDHKQYNPNFGMAFKIKYADNTAEAIKKGTAGLYEYMGLGKNKANLKGYEQLKKQLENFEYYDVVFDTTNNSVSVVNKLTQKIMEKFRDSAPGFTGLNNFSTKKYPGRKIIAWLFNPKKFLPNNINMAYKSAERLEKISKKNINKVL